MIQINEGKRIAWYRGGHKRKATGVHVMAVLAFSPIPADYPSLSPGNQFYKLLQRDATISATATDIVVMSSVNLSYYGPGRLYDIELGGSFTYGPLGTVAGTVSSFAISFQGNPIATITGPKWDAGQLWAALSVEYAAEQFLFSGNDQLTGSDNRDELRGHDGEDVIRGLGGRDLLYGGMDDDQIYGGGDDDSLNGENGRDKLFGEDGNDSLHGGVGNDVLRGGVGDDRLYGDDAYDRIFGGGGRDYLSGGDGKDRLFGAYGNDTLYGGNQSDHLSGGRGKDLLKGGSEDDTLLGDDGDDRLFGETGNDSLTGGADTDSFYFNGFGRNDRYSSGTDTIQDFEAGEKIYLGNVSTTQVASLAVAQVGTDVTIALESNLVTVLDATLSEVQTAIETYYYTYY